MAHVKVNEGFEANLMTNIWSWIFWLKIRILKKILFRLSVIFWISNIFRSQFLLEDTKTKVMNFGY